MAIRTSVATLFFLLAFAVPFACVVALLNLDTAEAELGALLAFFVLVPAGLLSLVIFSALSFTLSGSNSSYLVGWVTGLLFLLVAFAWGGDLHFAVLVVFVVYPTIAFFAIPYSPHGYGRQASALKGEIFSKSLGIVAFVIIAVLAMLYFGSDGSDKISSAQAREIREANEEIASTIPVFIGGVTSAWSTNGPCAGLSNGNSCALILHYETQRPLADVFEFYDFELPARGWMPSAEKLSIAREGILTEWDSVDTRSFRRNGQTLRLSTLVPSADCPDDVAYPLATPACQEHWLRSHGGQFTLTLYPE